MIFGEEHDKNILKGGGLIKSDKEGDDNFTTDFDIFTGKQKTGEASWEHLMD